MGSIVRQGKGQESVETIVMCSALTCSAKYFSALQCSGNQCSLLQ